MYDKIEGFLNKRNPHRSGWGKVAIGESPIMTVSSVRLANVQVKAIPQSTAFRADELAVVERLLRLNYRKEVRCKLQGMSSSTVKK